MTGEPRKLRLDLAYDGTDFAGWQIQPAERTVQGVLEEALGRIQGGERVVVHGAGRTDAGVHARGQVAHTTLRTRFDDERLHHALCGMLPRDLRPFRVRTTVPEFDSRSDARSKTYEYRLDLSLHGDPLLTRFALHYPYSLDFDRLESALRLLPGRRDWSGFTAGGCEIDNRVRTMTEARIERETDEQALFVFTCDGFLQHMVRNMVGTLLEIGGGRMPVETIGEVLTSGDRTLAGPSALPRGLCLSRVVYSGDA